MKTNNRTIETGMLYRTTTLLPVDDGKEAEEDQRKFDLSFSSEEPVERFFGIEVLDHREESVKLDWLKSGRAPLLLDHDPAKQIGVVESASVAEGGRGKARIRFGKSELAESAYRDVLDGIKTNISVGYRYMKDGVTLDKEADEGQPNIYRIKGWEPLEVSLVSIPADHTVGIGRSESNETVIYNVREDKQIMETAGKTMNETNMLERSMDKSISENPNISAVNITQEERNRASEIIALGRKHHMEETAMDYVKSGKSVEEFRQKVLDNLAEPPAISTSSPEQSLIGMNKKERGSFSILKAIRAVIQGNWQGAELEKEASDAVSKQVGRDPTSFFVPLDVTMEQRGMDGSHMQTRNLEKLSNIAGGYLVGTDHMAGSFIEMLRNNMLVRKMGARVMSGLHGDVAIPKQTGGASTFWVSEGQAPQSSQQSFGQVTLSPRSVAAYTDFTRKLILQSSPDIENLVRSDLATVIALEIDRVAINGSGKGAEPPGILQTRGINEVTIVVDDDNDADALSWGKIVDLESSIAAKNADIGSLGYLCNANMRGMLKQKEKAANTAQFIWEGSSEPGFGYLNGYRVGTTNQMPAATIIFGNFSDLIIGQWGVLDVLVDPYTLGTSGGIRIRVMQDVDMAVRHAESFAVAKV